MDDLRNVVASAAPVIGTVAGGYMGNAALGQQIGAAAGQAIHVSSAGPQFAPAPSHVVLPASWMDDLRNVVASAAPVIGTAAGAYMGNAALGQQIGAAASQAIHS
jgi:hypothetical protein